MASLLREWRECHAVARAHRPSKRMREATNAPAPGTTPKATRPKPAMREEPAAATAEVPAKAKESLSAGETEKGVGGGETPSE